jgi:hypothetical protein
VSPTDAVSMTVRRMAYWESFRRWVMQVFLRVSRDLHA